MKQSACHHTPTQQFISFKRLTYHAAQKNLAFAADTPIVVLWAPAQSAAFRGLMVRTKHTLRHFSPLPKELAQNLDKYNFVPGLPKN
jgi:predicted lipase